jgi:hypothetical protein
MHPLNPVILSDARILGAYVIFCGSYFVFALGKFPGMKIDRPGAAIIGAVLMVALRIMSARDALAAIDFCDHCAAVLHDAGGGQSPLGRIFRLGSRIGSSAPAT